MSHPRVRVRVRGSQQQPAPLLRQTCAGMAVRRADVFSRPRGMPARPDVVFRQVGWRGWDHWLGRATSLPFAQARRAVHSLKITTTAEWSAWCASEAKHAHIPSRPDRVYLGKGWRGWPHWLGADPDGKTSFPGDPAAHDCGPPATADDAGDASDASSASSASTGNGGAVRFPQPAALVPPFKYKRAQEFARLLSLAGEEDWRQWCATGVRPNRIPEHPDVVYAGKGWRGWGKWLAKRPGSTRAAVAHGSPQATAEASAEASAETSAEATATPTAAAASAASARLARERGLQTGAGAAGAAADLVSSNTMLYNPRGRLKRNTDGSMTVPHNPDGSLNVKALHAHAHATYAQVRRATSFADHAPTAC